MGIFLKIFRETYVCPNRIRWRLINDNIAIITLHVCGTDLNLLLNAVDVHLDALDQLLGLVQLSDSLPHVECRRLLDRFDPCTRLLHVGTRTRACLACW